MALQLRPRHRPLYNLSLVQFFSSSNTSDSTVTAPPPHSDSPESDLPPPQPRASSLFSDVKAKLRTQEHSQRTRQQLMGNPISSPSSNPHPQSQEQQRPKGPSLDEIRKGLSEFPPRPTTGEQRHSYAPHMAYENVINRGRAQSPISDSDPSSSPPATTFSSILKSLKSNTISYKPVGEDRLSLTRFKEDLKLKPDSATASQNLFDRKTNRLPFLVGREEKEGQVSKGIGEAITTSGGSMNTDFHKIYSYQELGEKLRNLRRPEKKGKGDGGGFSFLEMNERLVKLRELEEKRIESRIGTPYSNLRNSLLSMGHQSEEEKAKKKTARSIDILGHLAPTPDSMAPPQEHLVEKYFHPDNMSSAEKLKIELTKVRDEFKMSESDCGSARVQVAQLTTKIKHLSSTLHKKDKHSRKGLEGMVQKRKTLLRYLRRTDWDSYCLVLSKLGLRDNPAYKL